MATNTNKHVLLPISRVKTIMKSSPEVENISNESIHLVAKATELFIQYLARESFMYGSNNSELQYRDIAKIVDSDQRFEFLRVHQQLPDSRDFRKTEQEVSQKVVCSKLIQRFRESVASTPEYLFRQFTPGSILHLVLNDTLTHTSQDCLFDMLNGRSLNSVYRKPNALH